MKRKKLKTALSYDDVLLVPQHGVLEKRKDADISSELFEGFKLDIPILSANMPSVTEHKMAVAMYKAGGFGFLHRFSDINIRLGEYNTVKNLGYDAVVSIGLEDSFIINELYNAGCRIFCLDVAHGDHSRVEIFVYSFKNHGPKDMKLIVGNVATAQGAATLIEAGADAIKIGIGPGAACRTREVTGFGVPQLTAIMNVTQARELYPHVKFIADGGIKNSGDIVKALAAGADTVMIGSLLAGCDEAPNPGEYYGNASANVNGHRAPEGIHGQVKRTGPVEDVIKELAWGIRSGVSYAGGKNLDDLRRNCEFIQVTAAGQYESQTRLEEQYPMFKVYAETGYIDHIEVA